MSVAVWVIGTQFLAYPVSAAPASGVPSSPTAPPKLYKQSAHGTSIKDLFDITAESVLNLTNVDENGSGDIGVWVDGESGAPDASGSWTAADDLFLDSDSEPFVTGPDPVYVGVISHSASLVAGTLSAPSEDPVHVTGIVMSTTIQYINYEIEPVTTEFVFVVSRHETVAEAEDMVDGVRNAEEYDPDEPIAQCIDRNGSGMAVLSAAATTPF